MNKKFLTSGLLAGLVAGSGAGLILQSTGFAGASGTGVSAAPAAVVVDDTTVTTDSTVTTDTADTTDSSTRPDRSARLTEVLQPLVDDGTITADQLTAIIAALDAAGPMGRAGDGPGGRGMGMGGDGLTAVAEVLGLTEADLQTALQGGQTLSEIAADQGVEVQTVIDTLVTAAGAHLAEHVTAGDLTQEEADAKLAELTTRISDAVANGGPLGGGRGGEMGGRGGHGPRGDADDDVVADAEGTTSGGVTVDESAA